MSDAQDQDQSQSQSQGSVSPSDNILLDRLGQAKFEASIKFYEADQKLQPEDREQIANDLFGALTRSSLFGLGSSVVASLLPTIYARTQNIQQKPVVGPGLRPFTPRLYKPFVSFLLGLTTLMVVNQQTAKYQFTQKLRSFEDSAVETRQGNVWRAMDYHQAGMFYVYFRKTAEDPSFIIHDPRTYTKKNQHEVHYHPPKNHKGSSKSGTPESAEISHWDKIRISNGFQDKIAGEEAKKYDDPLNDNFQVADNESEEPVETKPKSAWDAIRQGRSRD